MHSGWTLALSSSLLCLSMQNFAPVSGLALDPYSSNASLGFPYPAQNIWPPSGLQATAGPYQQQGPYQPQGHSWKATQPNSTCFHSLILSQQIQYPQLNVINPMTPNYQAQLQQGWSPLTYQACQQPVGFVAILDAVLPSVAMVSPLSVAPFALAAAIQAPLAPQHSYASVAKSDEYEAISGRGRAKETIFSASLDNEQAIRLDYLRAHA